MLKKEKFIILKKKIFNRDEQLRAKEHLRGGVWPSTTAGGPVMAVAALGTSPRTFLDMMTGNYNHGKLRKIKKQLRDRFDGGRNSDESLIHSTDNTRESWEYIEVCFPEEVGDIKNSIEKRVQSRGMFFSIGEKTRLWRGMVRYYYKTTRKKARDLFVRQMVH